MIHEGLSGKKSRKFPRYHGWPSSALIPLLVDDRVVGIACTGSEVTIVHHE